MRCKNIDCVNETTGKKIYCSLTCRNVFVNKYLRNYEKCSNTFKQKREKSEEEYLKNPKYCANCSSIIEYNKRLDNDKFCNHACSASFNNKNRKGMKYSLSEEGRLSLVESAWRNLLSEESIKKSVQNQNIKYNRNTSKRNCIECGGLTRKKKYCSKDCMVIYLRKNMDEYQKYRLDTNFNFNLSDYKDEFNFSLIEKYGWYSPSNKGNNLGGVSRDHMLSVREGFEMKIDPKIISHPANCKLMIHTDNISKNKNSIISLEELLERIRIFEEKYKNEKIEYKFKVK
jgi:hypothetical protein